tara:strand:+ start:2110 stop:3282 length:1173 start_codon:yes stop_codon:yes gene_type:complete
MINSLMPTYNRSSLSFEEGEGAYLFDSKGKKYLDFMSGIAVSSLGHSHPKLIAELKKAIEKPWHVSNLFTIVDQTKLANKLVENCFAESVFFTNSGAEALECLIKVVRKYFYNINQSDRFRIITFEGAFHGRTLATLAAGGKKNHLEGFGPVVDGFDQIPFGDFEKAKEIINNTSAAFLIEPIQGEGGIREVPEGYLKHLKKLSEDNGMLLCFDEVQCGIGRAGKLFAHQIWDIVPDVMAIAKGLGGGFPIGACLATRKSCQGMIAGTHGSTFGGNPLAMAAANAVLDAIIEDDLISNVDLMGRKLKDSLKKLASKHYTKIEEIRGTGLMLGIKFKLNPDSLVEVLLNRGLLVVGASDNVIRLLPPLVINDSHLKEALDIIDAAISQWGS